MMDRALVNARTAWGDTHPNPMVGAVVALGSQVIGEGFHSCAGEPHAEPVALGYARSYPDGLGIATLYVTLEPCSTYGRTPPCTEVIRQSGIRRVVVGAIDPNPAHAGRGIAELESWGINVVTGVRERACTDLNLVYNHWIREQKPFVAAKIAVTLDGKIATRDGDSKWITGEDARADVMRWRRYFPAVAVGSETVLRDNPRLTVRVQGVPRHAPYRIVFDRRLRCAKRSGELHLFSDRWRERTIAVTEPGHPEAALAPLREAGVAVWEIPRSGWWEAIGARCAKEGICGVLVEGGGGILSDLLNSGALHYLFSYRAPKLLADASAIAAFQGRTTPRIAECITLTHVEHAVFGEDQMVRGFVSHGA